MNKREALELTYEIWRQLPTDLYQKHTFASKLACARKNEYDDFFIANCPACEYAEKVSGCTDSTKCNSCPIDGWSMVNMCYNRGHPYTEWVHYGTAESAKAIADLVKKSLENLYD